MFLQRVVGFSRRGLRPEKEIMVNHRPNAAHIARHEKNLLIVAAEDLISEINEATTDVNPHECQVPLQRTSEPTAYGQRFRPVDQNFLGNLGAETWEGAKYLQPASNHHKQCHRVHPMA